MKENVAQALHHARLTWIALLFEILTTALLYAVLRVAGTPQTISSIISVVAAIMFVLIGLFIIYHPGFLLPFKSIQSNGSSKSSSSVTHSPAPQSNLARRGIPTYRIVVLGPSGAGKTTFLASLYKQLSVQRKDFGFYLKINTRQNQELIEQYRQIANPEREWPASTDRSQHTSWTFTCCVEDDKLQDHEVMKFEYLDYAGETITDSLNEQGIEKLDKAIQEADALLCLLDGQKVLALMEDQEIGYQLLQRDLPNILPYLQSADKPIHFVLTKWDLFLNEHHVLQSKGDPLRPVRDFLLRTDDSLRRFVHKQARKAPVRLIPISAVGTDFARLEDGQMKKVGKHPTPLQVEMPMICVPPDVFEARKKHIRQKAVDAQADPAMSRSKFEAFVVGWLVRLFGRRAFLPFVIHNPGPLFTDLIGASIDNLAERLERKLEAVQEKELQELQAQKEEAFKAIQSEEGALIYTLDSFQLLLRELQDTFPSSDLNKA